jgi:5-formyltetrahydrofolate cyclo-ligase
MLTKSELRAEIKLLKQKVTKEEKLLASNRIMDQIEKLEVFKKATTILAYWSMPDEVVTHDFIQKWYSLKTFLLPVISANELIIKKFNGKQNIVKSNSLNILEPLGTEFTDFNQIDLAIVPGVAFDKKNNRLGRGKGYYDKLLPKLIALKIGICFSLQMTDNVPVDIRDIRMDLVITENGI